MNRAAWKWHYRLLRIARRETLKATTNTILFGYGYIEINKDITERDGKVAYLRHVPIEQVYLDAPIKTDT